MHHALQLDEILLHVFSYCHSPCVKTRRLSRRDCFSTVELVALARTCRTFKEPALNVLWSELADLSPLARCLPEVCYQITRGYKWYTFHRPLEQEEWDALRSYTRRVRTILDIGSAFHPSCVKTFLCPPNGEPLFPNLRHLRCVFANEITPLLHQPFPALISLEYVFAFEGNLSLFQDSLESFPRLSPNLAKLAIYVHLPEGVFDKVVSNYICRWSNPQVASCYQITLNVDAVKHLSCASNLTRLSFTLDAALPGRITSADILCFNKLQELELYSKSLGPVSKLLALIQLPAVTDFAVRFDDLPSKQEVASFFATFRTSGKTNFITRFSLFQHYFPPHSSPGLDTILHVDDLRPIMAFKSLRHLDFNINWNVELRDEDLEELASAWHYLETLFINRQWGWRQTSHGITPDGLVRILRKSQSLNQLALAVDTRSHVEVPLLSDTPPVSRFLSIHVLDSTIETAAVPRMVGFFTHLTPSGQLSLTVGGSHTIQWTTTMVEHSIRWHKVFAQVSDIFNQLH